MINTLVAMSHIQRIFFSHYSDKPLGTKICFILHFFVFNIFALVVTGKRLKAHIQKQAEIKQEAELKTTLGRLKKRLEDKYAEKAQNGVKQGVYKALDDFIEDPERELGTEEP